LTPLPSAKASFVSRGRRAHCSGVTNSGRATSSAGGDGAGAGAGPLSFSNRSLAVPSKPFSRTSASIPPGFEPPSWLRIPPPRIPPLDDDAPDDPPPLNSSIRLRMRVLNSSARARTSSATLKVRLFHPHKVSEGSPATTDIELSVDEMKDSITQVLSHVCHGSQRSEGDEPLASLNDCVHGRSDEWGYGVDAITYVSSNARTNLVHEFTTLSSEESP